LAFDPTAPPPPALTIGATLSPTGAVTQTGLATVSGTVTCNTPAFVSLSGSIEQVLSATAVNESAISTSVLCTSSGTFPWSVSVEAQNGADLSPPTPFVPGFTMVGVSAAGDSSNSLSGEVPVSGTVTLNPSPAPPTTFVGIPSAGGTITGSTWLDAGASSPVGIASVSYELSGGSTTKLSGGASYLADQVISGSTPTPYGYIGGWNSTSVPNGTYTIQSVATDTDGQSTTSAPVTITVDNPTASSSVVSPSDGATESGTSALLDASATPDVTGVSFELTGGTLTNQVVATATETFFGWAALWDTTSVPNGTYTLQSVATYSGGTVTSTPITITVTN